MLYAQFRKDVLNQPVILSRDLALARDDSQILRNQLIRWQKKNLLIKLRRGVYMLNENDRKVSPSRAFIASQLYSPSYVSMEYALSSYGLIPERVADVTSITTRKTAVFSNASGIFRYQHVKPGGFRGFLASRDEAGLPFFIAEPEKAVVDLLYLQLNKIKDYSSALFEEHFRFQNLDSLKPKKIMSYAKVFHSGKLMRVAKALCAYMKESR